MAASLDTEPDHHVTLPGEKNKEWEKLRVPQIFKKMPRRGVILNKSMCNYYHNYVL